VISYYFHVLAKDVKNDHKKRGNAFLNCQKLKTLKNVGFVVLSITNRLMDRKVSQSFRKWSHWSFTVRDREWNERINKMRTVVFQHTKDTESQLVNVVRRRLDMWERKRDQERGDKGGLI
jgi:hypothetical protein